MVTHASWICLVRPKDWKLIRKKHLCVLPINKRKSFDALSCGDLLAFYVNPKANAKTNGIVGITEVESLSIDKFPLKEYNETISTSYPYRIKVILPEELILKKQDAIPLYRVLGYENKEKGFVIEPWINEIYTFIQLTDEQYNSILTEISQIKKHSNIKNDL